MNYKRIYNSLIITAKNRSLSGYVEKHHIIPKCLGGSDEPDNLVELTAREHFIAHLLLVKIHPSKIGMIKSVQMMCVFSENQDRSMNRMYGWLKEKHSVSMSESQSGDKNSQFGTMWISNIEQRISKKISKSEPLSEGWVVGRNSWKKLEKEYLKKSKKQKSIDDAYNHLKKFIDSDFSSIKKYADSIGFAATSISEKFKTYIVGYSKIVERRRPIDKEKLKRLL